MSYDNTNSIAIFKNKKEKDTHPDYRGVVDVEGTEYEVALWLKESKAGQKYMSGKIQLKKDEKPRQEPAGKSAELDETVPF
jgi:uncharacterized protein (DUF736 family)